MFCCSCFWRSSTSCIFCLSCQLRSFLSSSSRRSLSRSRCRSWASRMLFLQLLLDRLRVLLLLLRRAPSAWAPRRAWRALRVLLLPFTPSLSHTSNQYSSLSPGIDGEIAAGPSMEERSGACSRDRWRSPWTPSRSSGGTLSPPADEAVVEQQPLEAVVITDIAAEVKALGRKAVDPLFHVDGGVEVGHHLDAVLQRRVPRPARPWRASCV